MYLTETAIDSTLKCMATFPGESEAVITFLQRATARSSLLHWLRERVSDAGEPFLSYFTPERIKEKLLAAGFREVGFLTPELSAPLFSEGESSLPNPKRLGIASAVV